MNVELIAKRVFADNVFGSVQPNQLFVVNSEERAVELIRAGLAERRIPDPKDHEEE